MLPINTKVRSKANPEMIGVVCGYAMDMRREKTVVPLYLIDLISGFYNPEQTVFISTIVMHEDSIEVRQ